MPELLSPTAGTQGGHAGRRLRAGDRVRVRPLHEILRTLSDEGSHDGLPFMPEMVQHCGRELPVFKRVHKTCDLQHGRGGLRTGPLVTLEGVRCDGSAHGGCQAACTLLWHEDWLEPVPARPRTAGPAEPPTQQLPASWSEATAPDGSIRYRCQVTEQVHYTRPLGPFEFGQYWEDWRSGNVSLRGLLGGSLRTLYRWLVGLGVGHRVLVGIYNTVQRRRGGCPHPYVQGTLDKTPTRSLDLQPGEWVRIRPFEEIVATLDRRNRNRGLWFVPQEMGEYCGERRRVQRRVDRILDERTGALLTFKTPGVILEDVYCRGVAIPARVFCPRASALFWREIWLDRAEDGGDGAESR